jgi:hypothetical protein
MRHLLTFGGLLVFLLGWWVLLMGPTNARPSAEIFMFLGLIPMVLGMATIDIVEAIKNHRN